MHPTRTEKMEMHSLVDEMGDVARACFPCAWDIFPSLDDKKGALDIIQTQ